MTVLNVILYGRLSFQSLLDVICFWTHVSCIKFHKMSENIYSSPILEQIRCWHCKGYLSCAPICSLRNGNFTCGHCTPLNDTPSYRALALENALSSALFPCRFAQTGCTEKVLFDKATEHELSCVYQTFICPTVPQVGCKWEGSSLQIFEHFKETHPELILDNMELTVKTEENKEGILVTVKDGVVFIVKFKYDSNEKDLTYTLRYCNNETNNVSYRIQLFNDLDYSSYLKPTKALLYDGDFYDMRNALLLNLASFLQMAEYPNSVKIIFYLKVTREVDNIVDYKLLNSIRCYKCRHYLVHPIFDLNNHTICSFCVEKNDECTPSTNAEIKELIAKANYPCRWRDCTFIGKSDNIKLHELSCEFRYYECTFIRCDAAFKLNEAIKHFEDHGCEHSVDKISYKTSFAQDYKYKRLFLIFNKNIIVMQHFMINSTENEKQHVVEVFVSTLKSVKILAVVEFEHKHCKIKSDGFVLKTDEKLIITAKELPSCFKDSEELTVSVEIVDVIPN